MSFISSLGKRSLLNTVIQRRGQQRRYSTTTTTTVIPTTMKPSVAITVRIPTSVYEKINEKCVVTSYWSKDETLPREHLLEMVKEVDGLFCVLSDSINKELLEKAKNLKVVSTMSVGYDHVDIQECTTRKIKVGNTPGVLTETVADHIVALLLATARRLPEGYVAVKEGKWPKTWMPLWMCGKDVHGSTVGIIGMGRIGAAVAKRLQGFGCKIIYNGRNRKENEFGGSFVDLDTLLETSDFVLPLCPLTKDTQKLINATTFKKMKKDAILINASRGAVVDQDALVQALNDGEIGGCGLDVTTPEPLPVNHPLLHPKFADRVVVVPHIASASVATRTAMGIIAADNLISGLFNNALPHPLNFVNSSNL